MISIMIVDDHPMVREGLAAMLESERDFSVSALAATGEEENLTKVVKSLLWRQDMLPEEREIILCGTVPGEVYDELKREARQRAELTVLEYAEIGEYLKKQIAGNAARDTNEEGSYKAGGNC